RGGRAGWNLVRPAGDRISRHQADVQRSRRAAFDHGDGRTHHGTDLRTPRSLRGHTRHADRRGAPRHCSHGSCLAPPCAVRRISSLSQEADMKQTSRTLRRLSTWTGALALAAIAGCASVQTTESGTVGDERRQYMAGMVSADALQQEANKQYS